LRNSKGNVRLTCSRDNKPVAPPDIWAQMDALVPNKQATPPTNGFTIDMFAERKGYKHSQASKVLGALLREGKLTRVKVGGKWWYTIT
jgi:hypothetical protein